MTDVRLTNESDVRVVLSPDEMSAALVLPRPVAGENYTEEIIVRILNEHGVTHGFDHKVIEDLLKGTLYSKMVTVAKGRDALDGKDGYYDMLFATSIAVAPKILEDGSADYGEMVIFEMVEKNQKIAQYHKATQGIMGYTVTGKLRMPRRGKDKTIIRGRNFYLDDEGINYYSNIDGRIVFDNGKIMISEVYIVDGDLNSRIGNIDFKGDVLIHGNVCQGMSIQATGSVVVDGKVEGAYITAGEDVVIRQGVYGDSTGMIVSKGGNIYGRFFEAATLRAKDLITGNSLVNCDAYTEGFVEVLGSKGCVTSGFTFAMMGVSVGEIGNEAETPTEISVGVGEEFRKQIAELELRLSKIDSEIAIFKDALEGHSALRTRIFMAIDMKTEERKNVQKELDLKTSLLQKASDSMIVVHGNVFPGATVRIDNIKMSLKSKLENVSFKKQDGHITITKNYS